MKWIAGILLALGLAMGVAHAEAITVASTTSTEQSGLFGYLLPEFKKASGIDLKVVAVGTGQAIDMARRGDADVLFVHDQVAEQARLLGGCGRRHRDRFRAGCSQRKSQCQYEACNPFHANSPLRNSSASGEACSSSEPLKKSCTGRSASTRPCSR